MFCCVTEHVLPGHIRLRDVRSPSRCFAQLFDRVFIKPHFELLHHPPSLSRTLYTGPEDTGHFGDQKVLGYFRVWRDSEVYYLEPRREPDSFALQGSRRVQLKRAMNSMAVNAQKKVQLKVTETTFVTSVAEAEKGPKVRSLAVSQELVQRMVGLAESIGWKNPDRNLNLRHLPRSAVATLVTKLREALETESAAPNGSRSRMDRQKVAKEFFAVTTNRRQLVKVLDFLAAGGELNVEDA